MALHAVENLGDAYAVTRNFLIPLDIRRWLKLAVVVFFIGGGMNFPSFQYNMPGTPEQIPENGLPSVIPSDIMTIVAAAVVVAVVLALVFTIVGAIMEFVFVESLRADDINIRQYWSRRWRQGLRLFGFRIAIGLPVLGVFLGWMVLSVAPFLTGTGDPFVPIGVFLLGIPLLFLLGVIYALISGFMTVFVVPLMIKDETGVVAGWRRLWPSVKAEWKQYLAYAVVSFVLTLALGFLASFVLGIAALVLFLPLAGVGFTIYATVSLSSTVGLVSLGILAVFFVAVMVLLWALAQVPVLTYLRYYALLVLGDINDAFDIIPEQREAVRSEE